MDPQDLSSDQSPQRATRRDATGRTENADDESSVGGDTDASASADVDTQAERGGTDESAERASEAGGSRDVVVPMRVYKAVTVFTTLFAVVTVVLGFVLLDGATDRATASLSEVDPLLALVGVGLIVAGAAAYAFSTRFRAEGMGKPKDDTDEPSSDG